MLGADGDQAVVSASAQGTEAILGADTAVMVLMSISHPRMPNSDQTVAGWRCSRWIHESRASLDSKLVISA